MKSQLDTLERAFTDLANTSKRLAGAAQAMCNELGGFQVWPLIGRALSCRRASSQCASMSPTGAGVAQTAYDNLAHHETAMSDRSRVECVLQRRLSETRRVPSHAVRPCPGTRTRVVTTCRQ